MFKNATSSLTSGNHEILSENVLTREKSELIETKKANLIYFNVPESKNEDVGERMKHDFEMLSSAYQNEKIDHSDITTIFRVGKRIADKDRPLVVKFSTIEKKNSTLQASRNLSVKVDREIRKIYATPDRTPKQREEHKKLVAEMKAKNGESDDTWIIRNGKVVKKIRDSNPNPRVKWADLFKGT